jgi:sulfur-carrier protein
MKITVRYFASVRESVGQGTETVDTAATTVAQLRTELGARSNAYAQALAPERAVRASLNQRMCDDESAPLHEGAEVAFFPPVTGG